MSVTHRMISWYVTHTSCPPSMLVTHRVVYRGVLVTTRLSRGPSHTARYRGVSITHRVISWYVSHTACPPSMSVTHCVIYCGVSVTTGLSRGPSHTARYHGVSVHHTCQKTSILHISILPMWCMPPLYFLHHSSPAPSSLSYNIINKPASYYSKQRVSCSVGNGTGS